MSITEIKTEITQLPEADLVRWFEEFQADFWGKQIEQDAPAGRLDALVEEALREARASHSRPV